MIYSFMNSLETIQFRNKRKCSDGMSLTLCVLIFISHKYAINTGWSSRSIEPQSLEPLARALKHRRPSLRTLFSLLKPQEAESVYVYILNLVKEGQSLSCMTSSPSKRVTMLMRLLSKLRQPIF